MARIEMRPEQPYCPVPGCAYRERWCPNPWHARWLYRRWAALIHAIPRLRVDRP